MKVNEPYAPVTLPPKKINFIGTSILWSWALLDVVYHTATVVNVRHCHCLPLLATTSQYLPLLATIGRLVLFGLLVDSKPRLYGWFTWQTFVTCRCLPRRGNGALWHESSVFLGLLKPTIIVAFPRLASTCDKRLSGDSQHRSVCRVTKYTSRGNDNTMTSYMNRVMYMSPINRSWKKENYSFGLCYCSVHL